MYRTMQDVIVNGRYQVLQMQMKLWVDSTFKVGDEDRRQALHALPFHLCHTQPHRKENSGSEGIHGMLTLANHGL